MRITIIAIAGALVACTAVSALAAPKKALPSFIDCDTLAMQRGQVETERRASEGGRSPYRQFMVACLAGQISDVPRIAAPVAPRRLSAGQIQSRWLRCDTLAMQRGHVETERRSTDTGLSPYGQFMRACLRGQIPS